jgi:hypothetical protein
MRSKIIEPPPVFLLSIGDFLGVLHVRSDMREMFEMEVLGEGRTKET